MLPLYVRWGRFLAIILHVHLPYVILTLNTLSFDVDSDSSRNEFEHRSVHLRSGFRIFPARTRRSLAPLSLSPTRVSGLTIFIGNYIGLRYMALVLNGSTAVLLRKLSVYLWSKKGVAPRRRQTRNRPAHSRRVLFLNMPSCSIKINTHSSSLIPKDISVRVPDKIGTHFRLLV